VGTSGAGFPAKRPRQLNSKINIHIMNITRADGFLLGSPGLGWNKLPARPRVKAQGRYLFFLRCWCCGCRLGRPGAQRASSRWLDYGHGERRNLARRLPGVRVSIRMRLQAPARTLIPTRMDSITRPTCLPKYEMNVSAPRIVIAGVDGNKRSGRRRASPQCCYASGAIRSRWCELWPSHSSKFGLLRSWWKRRRLHGP